MTGQEATQYGQLIFGACDNLHLSGIQIKDPCSFGLIITHCNNPILENIICENQIVGFLFDFIYLTADNLFVNNCSLGFYLSQLRFCTLNRIITENTNIPILIISSFSNSTIEIEISTPIYLINFFGLDTLHLNSSENSFALSPSFQADIDVECFLIQINDTYTYHVNHPNPAIMEIDFIIVIFQPSQTLIIPGFPFFWFHIIIIAGILYLKVSNRYKRSIKINSE
jgi:hypothetical protein